MRVLGISKTSLWRAWKGIRTDLKRSSLRDVIDYLEYDVDPDVWIRVLLRSISSGRYEPEQPIEFTLAKSTGFNRVMTLPSIPDLVLYRAITAYIYERAKGKEAPHVYFLRSQLKKTEEHRDKTADVEVDSAMGYRFTSRNSFLNWKQFHQYRKHLVMDRVYPFIVNTDITNYFHSLLHVHLAAALREVRIPRRMIGLLFFLLERLVPRHDFYDSPRIGLPIEEFDGSRTLAHVMLFEHDRAMIRCVGQDAYVRWMDDQGFGVRTRAEGLKVLSEVQESLRKIHLVPNAKKSRILSLDEATIHFHFDTNDKLDRFNKRLRSGKHSKKPLQKSLKRIWRYARKHEGKGEWGKVLKRFYLYGGLTRAKFLRDRAISDLIYNPDLADRISAYMRCSGSVRNYLKFFKAVVGHQEQVYESVTLVLTESLLRLEPGEQSSKILRRTAKKLISGKHSLSDLPRVVAIAPLILLRYGDRRSNPLLKSCIEGRKLRRDPQVVRSVSIVYASNGPKEFSALRRVASRLLRNNLAEMVRLVERIKKYENVPVRYKARLFRRLDPVVGKEYVDMRTLLTARLLRLNRKKEVQNWLRDWKKQVLKDKISDYDKQLVRRLLKI